MPSRPPARKSARDTLLANAAADRYYAVVYGKAPQAQPELAPKRTRTARPRDPTAPSEHNIQDACIEYLQNHPRVAWVGRFNSGKMPWQTKEGRIAWVGFYRLYLRLLGIIRDKGHADIAGMLKGGRYFCMEVKVSGKDATSEQEEFLQCVQAGGGISGVVRSVDDAVKLLEGV